MGNHLKVILDNSCNVAGLLTLAGLIAIFLDRILSDKHWLSLIFSFASWLSVLFLLCFCLDFGVGFGLIGFYLLIIISLGILILFLWKIGTDFVNLRSLKKRVRSAINEKMKKVYLRDLGEDRN